MQCHRFTLTSLALITVVTLSNADAAESRRTDNAVIHVQVTGHGQPMLLIPGLTCPGEVWDGAVTHYQDRYECHVVTLGGFAGQPRYEGPFLTTARDALLAYIRSSRLRAPIVVGHSLGGVLALEMALAEPRALGPLVIVDALPFLGGAGRPGATVDTVRASMVPFRDMIRSQSQEEYAAFQRQSPFLREMVTGPEDLARVTDWATRSDHTSVADAMFETYTTDLRDSLDRIATPVLVLGTWYGMRRVTTRAAVEATFRSQFARLPQWTLSVADSARHFVMLDNPDWTWKQVDSFLAAGSGTAKLRGATP